MIQKGGGYYRILSDAYSFHPENTSLKFNPRLTFSEWLNNGSGFYTVKEASKKGFVISTSPSEISSALLTEAYFFLNHCYEHLIEISNYKKDDGLRSDSWATVTVYYFGFFAAQSFLRLVGRPTFHLTKNVVNDLITLSPSIDCNLGAGPYLLSQKASGGGAIEDYHLEKQKWKIHDLTWIKVFDYLRDALNSVDKVNEQNEKNLYSLVLDKRLGSLLKSSAWPPIVRAATNYRPGYTYRLLEKVDAVKFKKFLRRNDFTQYDSFLSAFESALSASDDITKINYHVQSMYLLSLAIFGICETLFLEIKRTYRLDKSFDHKRVEVLKKEPHLSELYKFF